MLKRLIIFLSLMTFAFSVDLFFSEYAEGSSNNKYMEIYNPMDTAVELSGYAFPNVSNAPSEVGMYEYWNTFTEGAVIQPGDVYVICHPSSDDAILAECDQTHNYMSNGDDGYCLASGTEDAYFCIDWIGDFNGDPGSSWDVCGVGDTQDNTLVRKSSVTSGSDWSVSSNVDSCEWDVYDNNTWDNLGFHNIDPIGPDYTVNSGSYYYTPSILTVQVGETVEWINDGGFHDVVVTSGPVEFSLPACTGPCTIGSYTFEQPGTYDYICSIGQHAAQGMVGTVIVEGDIQLPCEDETACNFLALEDCTYPAEGECDCDGNVLDCAGVCGGDAVVDSCGECGGSDDCTVQVIFQVDMSLASDLIIEGNDMRMRISTIDGEYSPSDWYAMVDDDGDLIYKWDLQLAPGVTYGYNFNNGQSGGAGYEDGDNLDGVCAAGLYGNDRILVGPSEDTTLDVVCWESCDACPEQIFGCTDDTALNYDPTATDDDGSCIYEWPESENLFFSEYAEGSSNNKYLEIFNATDSDVDLSGYSLSSCSNGCDEPNTWDYPDNVILEGSLSSGEVYVVCNPSADQYILDECDQTFVYLSNGDDVFALTQVGSGLVLDVIGLVGEDPGSGWDVAGVSNATKDHTLVRKSSITSGNPLWLDNPDTEEQGSAGDDADDSEWIVLEQNDWTYLGYHEMDGSGGGDECGTEGDVNGDEVVNVLDVVTIVNGIVSGVEVECADLNGDGVQNVLDIVLVVGIITSSRTIDASSAVLNINGSSVILSADGYIGGVQMTLIHDDNFELSLSDDCLASNYKNYGNYTIIVIAEPKNELLFTANDSFEIQEIIVANSENEINVSMISDFSLSAAYPNPFNPSTSFDINIPSEGYLSVKVYDLSGKLVDVIANGVYNQNTYTFTWNGSGMSSGMYVINAEYNNTSISHNISLIK